MVIFMGYQRPVPYSRSTSWAAHKRRRPPSTEAGIDMFCPIGTPVLAAESGRIADTGDSIGPATGRFVTLDIDDGRRARYLHLSRRVVNRGDRVKRGQIVGYSGATGYGEEDWSWNVAETGGAHVHMTLWPSQRYVFGSTGTLDPEPFFDAVEQVAGLTATPIIPKEWDEMATEEQVANVTRTAAAEAVVNALKDKSVTDTLALVIKNELAQKMYAGDLSLIPIAELGNAMFLRASSTRRRIQVQNEDHVRFVQRALENRGTDIMSSAEVDIVDAYCLAVYPPDAVDVDVVALSAALNVISKDQSTETIRAAVTEAINAHTSTIAFVQKPAS